ncbi:MAG TPA: hypothetical protein VEB40_15960 [Flavipsychrobacter sp.]|nr:hypothetical protein [Flavipsychrobacter sp.]
MAVDKTHITQPGLYFITFTNHNWLPLFQLTNSYDLVYKWFDHLKCRGHLITGYVIMPNHIHVLINFGESDKSLNTIVGEGKRFLAYGIVKRLQTADKQDILAQLQSAVQLKDQSRGKKHEVFKDSFDIKECRSIEFARQKLDYIHANPVSKKWSLAADMVSYPHGSARYYLTGVQGEYEVVDCFTLF